MNIADTLIGSLYAALAGLESASTLLIGLILLLLAGFVGVTLAPPRFFRRRRKEKAVLSVEQMNELELDARLLREEFIAATGRTPERYRTTTMVIIVVIAGALFAFTFSWGLSLVALLTILFLRNSRRRGAIEARRAKILVNEVVPTAQGISGALSAGMSLSQALGDIARGSNPSQLQSSIRRALTDSRGIEEGMRAERRRTNSDILREFYEILADGASTSRQSAVTAETLDKFADLSMSRRSAYQAALRVTMQARSTRTILTILVPGVFAITVFMGGDTVILQKPVANLVVLVVMLLIACAYWITDLFIKDVVTGY